MPYILKTTESFTVHRHSTRFFVSLFASLLPSADPTATLGLWQEGAGAEHGVTMSDTTFLALACVLLEEPGEMG